MTDGKLVRDFIPDLIRASGRSAVVRHISGGDLEMALISKLQEEAAEVSAAAGRRHALVEELADVTEVMAALMKHDGITQQEVLDAARTKAALRGTFDTGAYLVSPDGPDA